MKACSKCKKVKSLAYFTVDSNVKSGKGARCKECKANMYAEYLANNKEKIIARSVKYRANNKRELNAKAAKYRNNNKEKIAATSAKHYANNKEKINYRRAKYRRNGVDTISDVYVRQLLARDSPIQILQELIELKRIQLLIKRELRK